METRLLSIIKSLDKNSHIGDDCALLSARDLSDVGNIIVTKDCMAEGVHFDTAFCPPYFIGLKLAISNLSDIGAAGGIPRAALLGLGFSNKYDEGFYKSLINGIATGLRQEGVKLIGGDTVSGNNRIFLSLTLIGVAEGGKMLRRDMAMPEDVIMLSSPVGHSRAGLMLLTHAIKKNNKFTALPLPVKKRLKMAHIAPSYPKGLGRSLLKHRLSKCAIDISDGLSSELWHIANMSKVRCTIYKDRLPVTRLLRLFLKRLHLRRPIDFVLSSGEEYALLWTTPMDKIKTAVELCLKMTKNPPFIIGKIDRGRGVFLIDRSGHERYIEDTGYKH